jgi:5'-3' exonuclease
MKVLLIDGDLIAYKCAAAAESRTVIVKHLASGKEKEFKNRTELKKFLKEQNREFIEADYDITDVQSVQPIQMSFNLINNQIAKLEEFCWADKIEIYIGKGKTFRHALPLPKEYKAGRDGAIKPHYLQEVRSFMQNYHQARLIDSGIEVDDLITIRGYEEKKKGNDVVIATIDKDAYQSQGLSILNWKNSPWTIEHIPDVGYLEKKDKIVGNGLKFLAFQVLSGDDADTYCAYDLSKVKYGPTKALKALQDAKTEQEVLQVVIDEFKRLYPDPVTYVDVHGVEHTSNWLDILKMYWKCAYMKRAWHDPSDFLLFAKERGVEV